MPGQPMKRIEVFKTGTHRAMDGTEATYSDSALRLTAAAYDPDTYKAPICIGHPQNTDAPAYGWVQGLEFAGGTLSAWADDVEPSFAQAVRDGRYRNVSASFWRPDAPSNPKAGVLYLRHVGFLGAVPPAVKGLKTASFAAGADGVLGFTRDSGADALLDVPPVAGGFADLVERERAVSRAEVTSFCDRLEKEGRLLPALRGMAETVLLGAPQDAAVSFAEKDGGEKAGFRQALMKLLSLMPKAVEFGEFAPAHLPGPDNRLREFVAPAGYSVDPQRADLMARAERLMLQHGLSFADAARRAELDR